MRGLPRRFLENTTDTDIGEFRPVTVLFANFHNFSRILEVLSHAPEQATRVLNAYYRRAQAVVHRYDGIVNKVDMATYGDKLMALFGAPAAHEDDPLRAAYCALDLEKALIDANSEIVEILSAVVPPEAASTLAMRQRIGINTGTVFAGRVGGAQRYEYTVMGSAVNLSARLMAKATDSIILVSPATRAIVQNQIAVDDHPPLHLKGWPHPIAPGIVRDYAPSSQIIQNRTASVLNLSTMIGREVELELLRHAASLAIQGAGRVLAIVGEAGIGKSRLSSELLRELIIHEERDIVFYTNECQSYEHRTPYMAIRAPLRQLLDLQPQQTRQIETQHAELMQQTIEAAVTRYAPELVRFTSLLGDVLGVVVQETPLTRGLTLEQRRDRLQELVIALFLGAARSHAVVLLLEDVQWADASSMEVVSQLCRAISTTPLLLLLNYRPAPPIDEPWCDLATCQRIELKELSPERGRELLATLLNDTPPPAITTLLDRTQGNPFYIEELIRTLVESGVLARDMTGYWHLTRPLDQIDLPRSIEGVVVARLDRLTEAQYNTVQVASVIGRRFQHPVLEGVTDRIDYLERTLTELIAVEIAMHDLQEQDDRTYLFRHALLRDVAYESILYARRRELHQRVSARLEMLTADQPQRRLDVLGLIARHYLLAEVWPQAFEYHMTAGIQAQQRYANREALTLFGTALEIVPRLPLPTDPAARFSQLIDIHERRGTIHALLGETDDAVAAYIDALELLDLRDETHRETRIRLHRLLASVEEQSSKFDTAFSWLEQGMALATATTQAELARCYLLGCKIYYRQGELEQALQWANQSFALAEQVANVLDQAHALRLIGVIQSDQGDMASSIQTLEQARELWNMAEGDLNGLSRILNDMGAVYDQTGRWTEAVVCYEQALEISENIGDAVGIPYTSNNLGFVLMGQGELQRAYDLFLYSGERFNQIGSAWGAANTISNRGEVLLLHGKSQKALELFQQSITIFEDIKSRGFIAESLRRAAEAYLAMRQLEQAYEQAYQSLSIAEEMGQTLECGIAERVLGQIALEQADTTAALQHLTQSYNILKDADAPYELAKVHYWLARLWLQMNNHEQATTELRNAKETFTKLGAQRDLEQVHLLAAEGQIEL
ncbi:MAG: tetratricopeptide repeat protein [Chloroflexaceae bacterium]|nr:tetratricopeptide repeat protein [Chloroflexaceae bacterium]